MRGSATFASVLLVLAAGCATPYSGDGWLDGPYYYGSRYALDLGPIDLSRGGTQTYHLANLPGREWTFGVLITEVAPNPTFGSAPSHPARVRITIKSPGGEVLLNEEGRVDAFIWEHGVGDRISFYYTVARFTPQPNATNVLSLEIVEPDPVSCCKASLYAVSDS